MFSQPSPGGARACNGCDTRNDMLRRDLVERDMNSACKVLAGTRDPDPYTERRIRFVVGGDSEIDIDHVVALADAWQKGGRDLGRRQALGVRERPGEPAGRGRRRNRANGVTGTSRGGCRLTGASGEYVARVVSVKVKYQVWVTPAEREAMVRVLSTCAGTALPDPGTAPTTAAPQAHPQTGSPTPPPAGEVEANSSVSYENCEAARAAGAAPLLAGQPAYTSKLDRDGDGRAWSRSPRQAVALPRAVTATAWKQGSRADGPARSSAASDLACDRGRRTQSSSM